MHLFSFFKESGDAEISSDPLTVHPSENRSESWRYQKNVGISKFRKCENRRKFRRFWFLLGSTEFCNVTYEVSESRHLRDEEPESPSFMKMKVTKPNRTKEIGPKRVQFALNMQLSHMQLDCGEENY